MAEAPALRNRRTLRHDVDDSPGAAPGPAQFADIGERHLRDAVVAAKRYPTSHRGVHDVDVSLLDIHAY